MPPAAREAGRARAARAAFWMAVVAVVLRAPVGWRREGPDMAPSGVGLMLEWELCRLIGSGLGGRCWEPILCGGECCCWEGDVVVCLHSSISTKKVMWDVPRLTHSRVLLVPPQLRVIEHVFVVTFGFLCIDWMMVKKWVQIDYQNWLVFTFK